MKKIDLGQTIRILANVGVIAGIVFLVIELNQNTQQMTVQLEWQVNQKIFENNRDLLGDNPTPIYAKSVIDPEELSFEEFQVASALVFNFLNVWEDKYFMYQEGLISEREWQLPIDQEIGITLGNRFAQALWESSKSLFEPELVQYIDSASSDVDPGDSYQWWLDSLEGLSDTPSE